MSAASVTSSDIMVSVAMVTYNHEQYVAQAIESVLMQETDFLVELVIGEDCSNDGTRAIVVEYAQRYPDRIRPLLHERNLGLMGKNNFLAVYHTCQGKYVAILEGDDYWIDPHKLQKQVDFLDDHPECAFCLHDVQVVYEDGIRSGFRHSPPGHKRLYVLEDVLMSALSQTASLVFRNGLLSDFPDWFLRAPIGDWALTVLLAEHGSIGYLDELMSVWRHHTGGAWTGIAERDRLRQTLEMYDLFDAHLRYRYTATFEPVRAVCHYGLALDCWLNGLREEQAYWMNLVVEKFPGVAESLFRKVLDSTHEVETMYGYQTAEDAVNWTCDAMRMRSTGAVWSKKLRSEWYAGIAFKAYQASDSVLVHSASCRAVWHNWRILRNRGFVSRWASAVIGSLRRPASRHLTSVALLSSKDQK